MKAHGPSKKNLPTPLIQPVEVFESRSRKTTRTPDHPLGGEGFKSSPDSPPLSLWRGLDMTRRPPIPQRSLSEQSRTGPSWRGGKAMSVSSAESAPTHTGNCPSSAHLKLGSCRCEHLVDGGGRGLEGARIGVADMPVGGGCGQKIICRNRQPSDGRRRGTQLQERGQKREAKGGEHGGRKQGVTWVADSDSLRLYRLQKAVFLWLEPMQTIKNLRKPVAKNTAQKTAAEPTGPLYMTALNQRDTAHRIVKSANNTLTREYGGLERRYSEVEAELARESTLLEVEEGIALEHDAATTKAQTAIEEAISRAQTTMGDDKFDRWHASLGHTSKQKPIAPAVL
ncbi:hypothetical protein B0H16DRAFT_1699274 [Mycena metata]|uniref:Uncharacterized protein n=1 Tax=Mycena metata TaxID=1033252 RepID=A0AAD7HLE5_9AGAR|nr:hypothetical protein B0H16DRAFT_1699274 [Mycena metata]